MLREYHPGLRLNTTLPQKQRTEQNYLEPEEIGVRLNAIKGSEMEIPILPALWLSLRTSEITGLTWECVVKIKLSNFHRRFKPDPETK